MILKRREKELKIKICVRRSNRKKECKYRKKSKDKEGKKLKLEGLDNKYRRIKNSRKLVDRR